MNRTFVGGLVVAIAMSAAVPSAGEEPTKQDCIAANESAQELRRVGKLREARTRLALCVAQSCPGAVREDCGQRLTEIETVMPSIVFDVRDSSGGDVAASVTVDGAPLTQRLDGTSLGVDPGEHVFVFGAPGFAPMTKTLIIREGERDRRERIVLRAANGDGTQGTRGATVSEPAHVKPDAASTNSPTAAYIALGVGGVGLVVGGVLTALWFDSKQRGDSQCGGAAKCDAPTASDFQAQQTNYTTGLAVGYGVAIVGGAIGTILLLTSGTPPKTSVTRVTPRLGLAWAGIGGSF